MASLIPARRITELIGMAPWSTPMYDDVSSRIRTLIVDGQLSHGDRLPSERVLATSLRMSRTTVSAAYEQLRRDGLISSLRGAGSTVHLPFGQSVGSALVEAPEGMIAMTHAAPPAAPGIGAAYERALCAVPSLFQTPGYLPDGLPLLTERLAARLTAQGLRTSPEQLLITVGAQSALRVAARWAVSKGDRVLVEGLVYPQLVDALTDAGARISALPHGETPWSLDAITQRLSGSPHRAAFLTIDFHNPTGALLGDDDRAELARILRTHGVQAVIDETAREVVLDDIAVPASFATYDESAIVIGSAAKSLWGGLRVGWIRTPLAHRAELIQARLAHDLGAAPFEQLVLAEVLNDPDPIIQAGRDVLRHRRDILVDELAQRLPEFQTRPPSGGLSLWVQLPAPIATSLASAAERRGVLLNPGTRFAAASGLRGEWHIRLPYSQPEDQLREAVHRIALAWGESSITDEAQAVRPECLVV